MNILKKHTCRVFFCCDIFGIIFLLKYFFEFIMRRIEIIITTAFVVGSFFVFLPNIFAANSDVIINEIGAYEPEGFEWVEIWNKGNEVVDITNWKFWENTTNHKLSATGTADNILQPGEYAVICQNDEKFLSKYPGLATIFSSSWTNLKEDGEEVGLKDGDGNFIEKFTYIASPHFSLERKNSSLADYTAVNWQEHTSGNTVGQANSVPGNAGNEDTEQNVAPPPPVVQSQPPIVPEVNNSQIWDQIKLNEVVPNPEVGNEWVEIFNPTNYDLDLVGGLICDSRNTISTCKAMSGKILSGGWFKIDLRSVIYLNNDGDTVFLKNPEGKLIDQIVYSEENKNLPNEGEALARKIDGGMEWAITKILTSGMKNEISLPEQLEKISTESVTGASTSTIKTKSVPGVKKDTVKVSWRVKALSQGSPGEKLIFGAVESADPRGGILFYNWNFGDGVNLDGANVEHSYATSGIFTISVSATSTAGTVGVKNFKIQIAPGMTINNSGVAISEIVPNPDGNDNEEFIELYNTSSSTIDLSGWIIKYGEKDYELPEQTKILPLGFLVFERAVTKFALDNAGGRVDLQTPDKNIVDSVRYGKAESGMGYNISGKVGHWLNNPNPGLLVVATTTASTTMVVTKDVTKVKGVKISSSKTWVPTGGVSLLDARDLAKGALVKAKGVVSVLPGIFGSQYFYISDGASGIQVYQYKKDFPALKVGDLVEVRGEISMSGEIKRIKMKGRGDVTVLSSAHVVSSTVLAQEDLGEESEGGMVKIAGEITEIKTNFMYVDNGAAEAVIYFKQGAKIDKKKFKEGELVEITGVLEAVKGGWQIWPRGQEDVVVTGESEDLIKKNTILTSSGTGETAEKYLTATAGGITTLLLGLLARGRGVLAMATVKRGGIFLLGIIKRKKDGLS